MAAHYSVGEKIVFGIVENKPLSGFPPGHCRVRMSARDFLKVLIRKDGELRVFTVREKEGHWTPAYEQGRQLRPNATPKPPAPSL